MTKELIIIILLIGSFNLICHEKCRNELTGVSCISTWNDCTEDK